MWPGLYLWGYPFTAIAVAALPATLLAYERDRNDGRVRAWAPLLGLTCSWLQPWQGATVIAVVLGAEAALWSQRLRVRLVVPAVTIAATAAPIAYYALLSRFDSSWKLIVEANQVPLGATWVLVVALAPLAVPALFAYRHRPASFVATATLVWPAAALGIYVLIGLGVAGNTPLHALQGVSIPFAVLAVSGIASIRWPLPARLATVVAVALAGLVAVPGVVRQLDDARAVGDQSTFRLEPSPFFVSRPEQQALDFVRQTPVRGAVLAPQYLGQLIPGYTGRRTWVANRYFTPDYVRRVQLADKLFTGGLQPEVARDLVRGSGAKLLVADCSHRADLASGARTCARRNETLWMRDRVHRAMRENARAVRRLPVSRQELSAPTTAPTSAAAPHSRCLAGPPEKTELPQRAFRRPAHGLGHVARKDTLPGGTPQLRREVLEPRHLNPPCYLWRPKGSGRRTTTAWASSHSMSRSRSAAFGA